MHNAERWDARESPSLQPSWLECVPTKSDPAEGVTGGRGGTARPRPQATNGPTRREMTRHGATWRERWPIWAVGRTAWLRQAGCMAFGDGGPRAG
jgi:hypothetical protein